MAEEVDIMRDQDDGGERKRLELDRICVP